jgi:PAS domain S-box-containing protein
LTVGDGFPARILIVDDKESNRNALAARVRVASPTYTVAVAASGPEAVARLTADDYDIVLCDLVLGGEMDGIETTRLLHAAKPWARIVLFSGKEDATRKAAALSAGAYAYLSKPVKEEELFDTIGKLSSIRRTEQLKGSFEILAKVAYLLQSTFDQSLLAKRIVDGARALGFDRARLYFYDETGKRLIGYESAGSATPHVFRDYPIPPGALKIIQFLFVRDRPMQWNEKLLAREVTGAVMEPWMTDLDLHHIDWIDCPLVVGNEHIGILSIDHHDHPRQYTESDLEVVGVFAGLAAQALNNARLYVKESLATASLLRVLEEAPDAVVTTDMHGIIQFVSPSTERLLGIARGDILGRKAAELHTDEHGTPGIGHEIAKRIMADLESGQIANRRGHLLGGDGKPRPVWITVSLLHDNDVVIGTSGFIKDLGPVEAETQRYRDLLEGFGYGTVLLDEAGAIVLINRKAELLLGCDHAQGKPLAALLDPAARSYFAQRFEQVLDHGGEESLDLKILKADGSSTLAKAQLSRFMSAAGRGVSVSLYGASEITSLIHFGRLMALGEMVARVAHEINNPLNNILTNIGDLRGFLARQERLSARVQETLDIVDRNGDRIGKLVSRLRAFARPGDFKLVPLAINDVVNDSIAFFHTQLRNNDVELVRELAPDLPAVLGDALRLQQVFVNLVINADEAMSGQEEPKEIRIVSGAGDGHVWVEVRDTGSGLPEGARDYLFDAFFTTKPPSKGTGLGLPISRSILDMHPGGSIEAFNRSEARGACFRVQLNAAPGAGAAIP